MDWADDIKMKWQTKVSDAEDATYFTGEEDDQMSLGDDLNEEFTVDVPGSYDSDFRQVPGTFLSLAWANTLPHSCA